MENTGFKFESRIFLTLSKILCKCKQDLTVSFFLHLDSVYKKIVV